MSQNADLIDEDALPGDESRLDLRPEWQQGKGLMEDDDAAEMKRIAEREGRRSISIRADVGSRKACDDPVRQVMETFARIDVLVNNPGRRCCSANARLRSAPWPQRGSRRSRH